MNNIDMQIFKAIVFVIIAVVGVAAIPIGIHYAVTDEHYADEDIAKIYVCGRYGGEVTKNSADELGCLIDGEIYELDWTPDGVATSTSQ